MLKQYQHIFFDLDHTLWDYESNAQEALEELYISYALAEKGINSSLLFIQEFKINNDQLWEAYELGKISKESLRLKRFQDTFRKWEVEDIDLCSKMALDYITITPKKNKLFPYVIDVLSYLREKYSLHIITNGFEEVQQVKIKHAALREYFKEIITSDRAGVKKPNPKIFSYALELTGAKGNESIMIGDSPEIDLEGAKTCEMDQVFFNPEKISNEYESTHEIYCLSELKKFL